MDCRALEREDARQSLLGRIVEDLVFQIVGRFVQRVEAGHEVCYDGVRQFKQQIIGAALQAARIALADRAQPLDGIRSARCGA